ncbi:hypothetical protein CC80DRAFT_509357 [Byssothecium circinans]|uniref:Uncharacterized protein n=1 Tax=Byssothecium circinans TaxID=147558 RepID=A0A6A5TEM0_9PLEO|nr:hypothetical protein CC80DRAFT_509357 [Byssothecium circinans]
MALHSTVELDSSWGTSMTSLFTSWPSHSIQSHRHAAAKRRRLNLAQIPTTAMEDDLCISIAGITLANRVTPQEDQQPELITRPSTPVPSPSSSPMPAASTQYRRLREAERARARERSNALAAATSGDRGFEARQEIISSIEQRTRGQQIRRQRRVQVYRPVREEQQADPPPRYTTQDPYPLLPLTTSTPSLPTLPDIADEETRTGCRIGYRRRLAKVKDFGRKATKAVERIANPDLSRQRRRWHRMGPRGVGHRERMRAVVERVQKRWNIRRAKKKVVWLRKNGFLNGQERMLLGEVR